MSVTNWPWMWRWLPLVWGTWHEHGRAIGSRVMVGTAEEKKGMVDNG